MIYTYAILSSLGTLKIQQKGLGFANLHIDIDASVLQVTWGPACLGWSPGMAAQVCDIQILFGWHAHLQLMALPVDASNTQIALYSPKYVDS